jgi:hypothetical protein
MTARRYNVTLPPSLAEWASTYARECYTTRSALVTRLLREEKIRAAKLALYDHATSNGIGQNRPRGAKRAKG